jgi:hypothetical protein
MSRRRALRFLTDALSLEKSDEAGQSRLRLEIRGGKISWERVIDVASRHYVIVTLAAALREHGLSSDLPEDVGEYLEELRLLGLERNRRIREQVLEMARMLNGIGVEPLLIKGAAHLMSGLHSDPSARLMEDIDALVPGERLNECFDRLRAGGYDIDGKMEHDCHHADQLKRPGRPAWVELHRRVAQGPGESVITASELFARSRRIVVGDASFRVPRATDSALVAISHSYLLHEVHRHGVILFRDMHDLLLLDRSAEPPDWAEVHRRFRDAGYGALAGRCLTVAERLFGRPTPRAAGMDAAFSWDWWRFRFHDQFPKAFPFFHFVSREMARIGIVTREAFSSSKKAGSTRRKLVNPAFYWRHIRWIPRYLRRSLWR